MRTVISTDEVEEKDRFEFWREEVFRSFTRMRLERMTDGPFFGRGELYEIGDIRFGMVHSVAQRGIIDRAELRRAKNALYAVNLQLVGTSIGKQGRDQWVVEPGCIDLLDTTQPGEMGMNAESRGFIVLVPHHRMKGRILSSAPISGKHLNKDRPDVEYLSAFLRLMASRNDFSSPQFEKLMDVLVGLLAVVMGPTEDAVEEARLSRPVTHLLAINRYVEVNLSDKDLGPDKVAARFRISRSYLHKIFEESELTLMRLILSLRLERCRRDLADPKKRWMKISAIAEEWGFRNIQHFNHAFKRKYDMSPGEWRAMALAKLDEN